MTTTVLYRLASVLQIIFVAANTIWLVYFWRTAAANAPHFPFGHSDLTYVQVVLALEVFGSLCILFGAYLSWRLGSLARRIPQAIGALGWGLVAFQAVGTFVCLFYLSGFAFLVAAMIAVCTTWATSLVGPAPQVSPEAK
jgi:uncharacterized protein (DUF697 family)